MMKQILVAALLVAGATGGAFAQTRTINAWGAQFEVPAYSDATAAPAARGTAMSRFDQRDAAFTSMSAPHARSQSRGH